MSGLAQRAGIAALKRDRYVLKTRKTKLIHEQRKMEATLTELGYIVYPSQANYIFFMERLWKEQQTPVRPHAKTGRPHPQLLNYPGLDASCYRIHVKTEEEKQRVLTNFPNVQSPNVQI